MAALMVNDRVPAAPLGLVQLTADLAQLTEWIRGECTKGDAWMASAYSTSLVSKAQVVAIGVQQWIESIPPAPDPNVNPHGPIRLVGPSVAVAITDLSDAELADFDHQVQWDLDNERRAPAQEWLTRVHADVKRELAGRRKQQPTGPKE